MRSCLFLLLVLLASPGVAPVSKTRQIEVQAANAARILQRFHVTRALSDLDLAVQTMQSGLNVDELTAANFVTERRNIVHGWAPILKAIENAYDPTFDPHASFSCPVPPHEPSGVQLTPCVAPSRVQDPSARGAYSKAFEKYKSALRKAAYYRDLTNIDLSAMAKIKVAFALLRQVAPKGTPHDLAALDLILRQGGISDARRTRIDEIFH